MRRTASSARVYRLSVFLWLWCPLSFLFLDIIYFFGLPGFYFILSHFHFFYFINLFVYLSIYLFFFGFNQLFKIDTFANLIQCASSSTIHLVINFTFKSNRFNSCTAFLEIFSKLCLVALLIKFSLWQPELQKIVKVSSKRKSARKRSNFKADLV